jgi:hypothetical protein
MKVIAFDIATVTGVAFGLAGGTPKAWAVDLGKGQSEDARFSKALRMTAHYCTSLQPDLVAVEAAIGGKDANAYLIGLVACVRGEATRHGVRCVSYHSGSIRKHFIGKAMTTRDFPGMSAAKAKLAIKGKVLWRCNLLGWNVTGLDAADAAATWDFACAMESRAHQMSSVGGLFGGKK